MDLMKLLRTQWDRSAAVVFALLGAVCLLVGWLGVSDSAYLAEQMPYMISGGVGGVFFLGLAGTLWMSADLSDEWRKLDRIEHALSDGSLRWVDADAVTPVGYAGGNGNGNAQVGDLDDGTDVLEVVGPGAAGKRPRRAAQSSGSSAGTRPSAARRPPATRTARTATSGGSR
jgi:hypothetical protein